MSKWDLQQVQHALNVSSCRWAVNSKQLQMFSSTASLTWAGTDSTASGWWPSLPQAAEMPARSSLSNPWLKVSTKQAHFFIKAQLNSKMIHYGRLMWMEIEISFPFLQFNANKPAFMYMLEWELISWLRLLIVPVLSGVGTHSSYQNVRILPDQCCLHC